MAQQTVRPPFAGGAAAADEDAQMRYQPAELEAGAFADDAPAWRAHTAASQALAHLVEAENETISSFGVTESAFQGAGNISGVGVGRSSPSAHFAAEPGAPALRVYLVDPMSEEDARRVLAEELQVEDALDPKLPLERVVTGLISALPHTFRSRPAPGGISVGHVAITAGTLGCLARGASGERASRTLILSNNHVLANGNAGAFGDPIVQPGPTDGGRMPNDQIAQLERFVPIDFSGAPNYVDCATGWADPAQVREELVYLQGGTPHYFRVGNAPRTCEVDLAVGKSGRTTQVTTGRITDCSATLKVRFGWKVALFRDQISIVGHGGGLFSSGGDSGSLIFTNDEARLPVGLLFAGGGSSTFANHIAHVLAALDIDLIT